MLTIKQLKLKGIGRFVEEQIISFDKFGSLVQVDGNNTNTGGSSGAGKSTIFNALDFLFGLNSVPNSILQSRLTDESIFVEAEFDFDGQELVISRGKKLKITLNGEVTTGSAKLSEEKLDEILSVPRHLFRPMLHKKQGEKGFFLNFTPKETNDFLTDCLGLGIYKKHLVNLDSKISELAKIGLMTGSELSSTTESLMAIRSSLDLFSTPPVKEVDESTLPELKSKVEASGAFLLQKTVEHREELAVHNTKKPHFIYPGFDNSRKLALENSLSDLRSNANSLLLKQKDLQSQAQALVQEVRSKINQLEFKIQRGAEAKVSATKIASEIKKIRDCICPKCEQTWATESAKKEEAHLIENIAKLREFVIEGDKSVQELAAAKQELELAQASFPSAVPEGYPEMLLQEKQIKSFIEVESKKELAYNDDHMAQNRKAQSDFLASQLEITQRHANEISILRTQSEIDRRNYDMAVMKVKSYEEQVRIFERGLKGVKDQESYLSHRIALLEQELKATNEKTVYAEELRKAIKSYLSCSFDEALESIGANATQMIRNIPNMANATIQLEGLRETKEGKVKEEVTAVIHMDGDTNVDIRSLCGGERTSTDLAIDLSVVDFIESKTNKGINIFILDEPFTGLDTQCIEMALDMLQKASFNKKLIVVDHNPVVKEHISDRITVTRVGESSFIER